MSRRTIDKWRLKHLNSKIEGRLLIQNRILSFSGRMNHNRLIRPHYHLINARLLMNDHQ